MKKILLMIVISILTSIAVFSQSDTNDTQLWNETTVEFPLDADKKKVSGVVIGNLRATDDIGRLSDRRIGFGVKMKATKNITVTPSYIFRQQTRTFGRSNRYEHRLRLDIVPKKSFSKFSVENRNRFEHRFKTDGRDDDTFYRNRTKVKIPVRRSDKSEIITPFVSNDTYFDLQNPRIHRNDTAVGFSKKITESFSPSVFYQYRRNFQSSTKHINIIGIDLKFKIK